jgi:hypothetical protein
MLSWALRRLVCWASTWRANVLLSNSDTCPHVRHVNSVVFLNSRIRSITTCGQLGQGTRQKLSSVSIVWAVCHRNCRRTPRIRTVPDGAMATKVFRFSLQRWQTLSRFAAFGMCRYSINREVAPALLSAPETAVPATPTATGADLSAHAMGDA